MQIIISVGLPLLLAVYMMGIFICLVTFDDMEVRITPLTLAIGLVPILHWYYVFKYLDGGWHNWLKNLKERINEYKGLD